MDWMTFILICLVIGMVWVIITQLWMNSIDILITFLKKLFRLDRRSDSKQWHTLEEIRDKNKKD